MERKIEKLFSWFLLFFFAGLFILTWNYGARARLAPLLLLIPGMVLVALHLWQLYGRSGNEAEGTVDDAEEGFEIKAPFHEEMWVLAWFVAFAAGVWLLGFFLATSLFLLLFLRLWAKEGWLLTVILTGGAALFMYVVVELGFRIILYRGWLFSY